jgi:hypothetical protein
MANGFMDAVSGMGSGMYLPIGRQAESSGGRGIADGMFIDTDTAYLPIPTYQPTEDDLRRIESSKRFGYGGEKPSYLPPIPENLKSGNQDLNRFNEQATSSGKTSMGDFLTGTLGNQLLSGAGEYFLGREQIQDIEELGRQQQAALGQFGEQIAQQAEFRPFTVTTGLGTTTTTPTGGVAVGLSPEQQALQQQLLAQATGLFGQVGVSPAEAQADIYEQIRATQRPEEERQRLAMEERLLSRGRLGLQSAAYGGASPELLALETARQEAMARAGLSARQQALAEQQQALAGATGLLAAGYSPQQQALEALRIGTAIPQLVQRGQLIGAELQSQLGRSGIEANLAMQELAADLRQRRDAGLMQALMGRQPTLQEQLLARYVGMSPEDINQLGSGGLLSSLGFGDAPTPDWIKAIGDLLGFGGTDEYGFLAGEDPFDMG